MGPQPSIICGSCTSPTVEGQHWEGGWPPGPLRADVFSLSFDFGIAIPCSCQLARLGSLPRSSWLCCRPAFAQRRHLWSGFLCTVPAVLTFCSEVSGDSWVATWAPGWELWPLEPNYSSHLSGLPGFSEDTAKSQEVALLEEGRAQEEMGQGAPRGGGGTGVEGCPSLSGVELARRGRKGRYTVSFQTGAFEVILRTMSLKDGEQSFLGIKITNFTVRQIFHMSRTF